MRKRLVASLCLLLLAGCGSQSWRQQISYSGPVEISIDQGQYLPGTDVRYLGKTQDGGQLSIGGLQTSKRIGDSLNWTGDMLPGVTVDESLRVALVREAKLYTVGTVRINVTAPSPQTGPANESAPVHFKMPAIYRVAVGAAIPGTVITYLGKTDQGAHLGNVAGLAYRQLGDSIDWSGTLRDGVWISLSLRTAFIGSDSLQVIGSADVWIVPA
jgi:hypothetical protein